MSRTTRLVYIAHPLGQGPERAENLKRAARWVGWAGLVDGVLPVASWIVLASVWDEETGRTRGLRIDCQTISRCDEVWLCGPRISPGMQVERSHAELVGARVTDFTSYSHVDPPGDYQILEPF